MTELHPDDQAIVDIFARALTMEADRDFLLSWVIADPLIAYYDTEAGGWKLCTDAYSECGHRHVTRFLATGEYDDAPGQRVVLNLPRQPIRLLQQASPVADFRFWLLGHTVMLRRTGHGIATDYQIRKVTP